MGHREDNQLHYVSILPSNKNGYPHQYQRYLIRRSSEQDRSKPLYVDFENAFEDQTIQNDESFGFQPLQSSNIHLQSVEMISEVQNTHFRFYSRPSTPSDTPLRNSPQQSINNHRTVHFATTEENHSFDAIPTKFQQENIHLSKLSLPQYFLVKYLGRTSCTHLWGTKAVRTPIDEMVRNARQLSSINELPTLEACVNTRGLTLTHRQSPTRHKQQQQQQHHHGLIPLNHISYAMHDVKYSKIATCIVLRQMKSSTINDEKNLSDMFMECYTFLFQSKEHAHRFARAFAQAFSQSNSNTRSSRQNLDEKGQTRSRHRSNHQRIHHHHHHHHHRFFDSQV